MPGGASHARRNAEIARDEEAGGRGGGQGAWGGRRAARSDRLGIRATAGGARGKGHQ